MLVAPRRKTRVLEVGDVKIGGDNPIVVQSMATADTRDPKATLEQISRAGRGRLRDRAHRRPRPHRRRGAAGHRALLAGPVDRRHPFRAHARTQGARRRHPRSATQPGQHPQGGRCARGRAKAKERGIPIRIGVNYGSVPPFTDEFVDEMARTERHPGRVARRVDGPHRHSATSAFSKSSTSATSRSA